MIHSTVLEHGYRHDGEVDVRFVAQLSMLGSLADQILGDLIRADAGLCRLADSMAIESAATVFTAAASSTSQPADLWQSSGLSEALRRMSAAGQEGTLVDIPVRNDDKWLERLRTIAGALQAAHQGNASAHDLKIIETDFSEIARSTMDATLSSMQSHTYSTSWLTI